MRFHDGWMAAVVDESVPARGTHARKTMHFWWCINHRSHQQWPTCAAVDEVQKPLHCLISKGIAFGTKRLLRVVSLFEKKENRYRGGKNTNFNCKTLLNVTPVTGGPGLID